MRHSSSGDGLDRALLCLSSPLGIEWLPREQSSRLIDAYHDGALGARRSVRRVGSLALDRTGPQRRRPCVRPWVRGRITSSRRALERRRAREPRPRPRAPAGARRPLLVHPGPGARPSTGRTSRPRDSATRSGGRRSPLCAVDPGRVARVRLRGARVTRACASSSRCSRGSRPSVERLTCRGGPGAVLEGPLIFYETSSYGPAAVSALAEVRRRRASCSTALTGPSWIPTARRSTSGSTGTRSRTARCGRSVWARGLRDERVAKHPRRDAVATPLRPRTLARSRSSRERAGAISRDRSCRRSWRSSRAVRSSGSITSSTNQPARVRGADRRWAPHRVADLLDGRPRHRLSRPRPVLRSCRGRQRRGPRGTPDDRGAAARAA